MRLGATLIRAVVGPLFIGHGTQKLLGWFGGGGIQQTGEQFESLGLKPGKHHATAAGLAETLGGVLITLGLLTPVGATFISGTMVTAIRKVHAPKGPWATQGGYEYNLVLLAAMVGLTENGPGPLSLDSAVAPELKGTRWALLQLGAALAGSYVTSSQPVADVLGRSGPQSSNGSTPAEHVKASA
jgi:putative oxidoreductase